MKHFLIKYRFTDGTPEEWHREIGRFIAALDSDPAVKGKIAYRCMKRRDGAEYFHLATVADDSAGKALQTQAFFQSYTEGTKRVSGGTLEVVPLDIIAETAYRG